MMKLLGIFIVSLILGTSCTISTDLELEKAVELGWDLNTFIEGQINKLLNNITDTYPLGNNNISFTYKSLSGYLNITDATITGLNSTKATEVNATYHVLTPSSINITMCLGNVSLVLNYDTNVLMGGWLQLFGQGEVRLNVINLSISLFTSANIAILPIRVSGFNNTSLTFSLENATLSLDGFMQNNDFDELIDKLAQDIISLICADQETISKIINDHYSSTLDDILENLFKTKTQLQTQEMFGDRKQ